MKLCITRCKDFRKLAFNKQTAGHGGHSIPTLIFEKDNVMKAMLGKTLIDIFAMKLSES
jgi:hypothetical protein